MINILNIMALFKYDGLVTCHMFRYNLIKQRNQMQRMQR
jgi:hypothetical protein